MMHFLSLLNDRKLFYTYDPNGNLLGKVHSLLAASELSETLGLTEGLANAELYTYNGFNQLTETWTESGVTAYAYYANGLRASKTHGGVKTDFVLDGGNVVLELQASIMTAKYIRAMNLISATIGSDAFYYLYNAHGDVVQLANSSGVVTKTYVYDAFGVEKNADGSDVNPFRYCGEYLDKETGTYYLRARSYDPRLGRFTSEDTHWNTGNSIYGDDPVRLNEYTVPSIAAIRQSGNLYLYCGSNPILWVDPIGNAWYHWAIIGGLVAVAAVATILTAGGAAGAFLAVAAVASGMAAVTVASTIAASIFISTTIVAGIALMAADFSSRSSFADSANWGTVAAVAISGGLGALQGYELSKSIPKIGTIKGSTDGLTKDELKVVNELKNGGANVEIIQRSNSKSYDFKINSVSTELKTLQNANVNTGITRIKDAFKQNSPSVVIIDARGSGLTQAQAQNMISRAAGTYSNKMLPGQVQVWTDSGTILGGK